MRITLRSRLPIDHVLTWTAQFAAVGQSLIWAVTVDKGKPPLVVATDPNQGAKDAEWVAARLARAAYLETVLLNMLGSLQAFGKNNPHGFNVGLSLVEVVQNLAAVYNGQIAVDTSQTTLPN